MMRRREFGVNGCALLSAARLFPFLCPSASSADSRVTYVAGERRHIGETSRISRLRDRVRRRLSMSFAQRDLREDTARLLAGAAQHFPATSSHRCSWSSYS